jgi:dTDP-4-dehydrorhamnose reductase
MRILITGAQGQLGHALQQALSGEDLILKDLPEFDLTQSDSETQIVAARPSVILHVGAYTNVDGAERETERAMAVNAQGTTFVARAAATLNARLIYVSTDYVFDGTQTTPYREEDVPHPINAYGQSKRAGEIAALTGCPNTLVVRTAWLYGHDGNNFVKTIMRLASEKPFLEVVGDQRGCPTNADDLALALKDLLASDLRGICHVTNTGDCTWHELAEAIVSLMDLSTPVRPITTVQAGRLARRPAYSVLSQGRLGTVRALLPHWKDALARFMRHAPRLASTPS